MKGAGAEKLISLANVVLAVAAVVSVSCPGFLFLKSIFVRVLVYRDVLVPPFIVTFCSPGVNMHVS